MRLINSIVSMVVIMPLFVSCSLDDKSLLITSYTYINDTPWDITLEAYSEVNKDVIISLNSGGAVITLTYYSSLDFALPFNGKNHRDSIVIKTKNHVIVQEARRNDGQDDLYDKESYIRKEIDDDEHEFVYIFNKEFFE